MLLNAPSSLLTASPTGSVDPSVEGTRVAAPSPPPPNGRALLPVLEQLAQQELATMVALQPVAVEPISDPAFAGLAWDLGLTGSEFP